MMSDSFIVCNLCCRVIEKSYERLLLSKGWKQFDILAEFASLQISVRSSGSNYICRNCVAKLKKRRGLLQQIEKLEGELKSLRDSEDSLAAKRAGELLADSRDSPSSKRICEGSDERVSPVFTSSPVRSAPSISPWPVSPIAASQPLQPARPIEEADVQSGVKTKTAVDVSIRVKWPSKDKERKLPEDLESLGKMLARGTYKQISNAVWKNASLKKEITKLLLKDVEKECSQLCSKKNPSCLRKTSKEDMLSFSMETLTVEIKDRAPLLYSLLSAAAVNPKSKAKNPSPQVECGAIGMAAAICLRNRSKFMIAVQLLITDFLYHSNWLVSRKYNVD